MGKIVFSRKSLFDRNNFSEFRILNLTLSEVAWAAVIS